MSAIFLLLVVFAISQGRAAISENAYNDRLPANCFEATYFTHRSGSYVIQPFTQEPFTAYCDSDLRGGGWTVIQRRKDGSVDFFLDWKAYKNGFGNVTGEFWIGLDRLHALTVSSQQELLVVIQDFYSKTAYALYDSFAIGKESENYYLKALGRYSGDAYDSLTYHKNCSFKTKDKDGTANKCAFTYKGAWWYSHSTECHWSNLNGLYFRGPNQAGYTGTVWRKFNDKSSLKYVSMMVRPKQAV